MKKGTKETIEIGTCGKCGEETIDNFQSSKYGRLCGHCDTEVKQKDLAFDEYDWQPDEMTKEEVADELKCSIRYVEILKKNDEIAAVKKSKYIKDKPGEIRKQLVFMNDNVQEYKTRRDAIEVPTSQIETEQTALAITTEQSEILLSSAAFAFQSMAESVQKIVNPNAAMANEPQFLTVKEAAKKTRLSQSQIKRLIESNVLIEYKGSHNETLISNKQLSEL